MNKNTEIMVRKFKIGFYFDMFSNNYKDWEKEAKFNLELEPDFVEIMLEYPGSSKYFTNQYSESLMKLLDGVHLTLHAPTLNISLVSMNEEILKASVKEHIHAVDASYSLNSTRMTIHAGEYPFYAYHEGNNPGDIFNKCIPEILDYAKSKGVQVLVENLKGKFVYPKMFHEIDKILESNPSLMLAFDIRHFILNDINPLDAIKHFFDRVKSIHFRVDCGLSENELTTFITWLLKNKYSENFIIEDQALNMLDKLDKTQLHSGHSMVCNALSNIGVQ